MQSLCFHKLQQRPFVFAFEFWRLLLLHGERRNLCVATVVKAGGYGSFAAADGLAMASYCARLSLATVYTVGGPPGWTTPTRAKINYTEWASSTSFKIGDILEFNYVPKAHTVLEVTRTDFRYCNKSHPLALFDDPSGRTEVELTKKGNYYFIDGVGQHCDEGQKFQASVSSAAKAEEGGPSMSSSPSSAGTFGPSLPPSIDIEPAPTPTDSIPPAVASAPSFSYTTILGALLTFSTVFLRQSEA